MPYDYGSTTEVRLTVQWKDPPVRGPGAWQMKLRPLMQRPGEWALVHKSPTARAAYNLKAQLANGRQDIPEGLWEFRSAAIKDGGEVYARYIGKGNAAVEAAA